MYKFPENTLRMSNMLMKSQYCSRLLFKINMKSKRFIVALVEFFFYFDNKWIIMYFYIAKTYIFSFILTIARITLYFNYNNNYLHSWLRWMRRRVRTTNKIIKRVITRLHFFHSHFRYSIRYVLFTLNININ